MAQEKKSEADERQDSSVSLVPLYSPLDVSVGLQAYRRGDMILYTIRGEPAKVQELIQELDERGTEEVVALVSHRVGEVVETAEAVVEAEKSDQDKEKENEEDKH
ncbi:MAG: hypothetical protein ACLFWL_12210 [Candidatus Brocadiia bacterium]